MLELVGDFIEVGETGCGGAKYLKLTAVQQAWS